MKRILITGAGGSAAANFVRSLRVAPERMELVGTDCNKYHIMRAETDKRFLIPLAKEKDYIDVLNQITDENRLEFLHVQNDVEISVISENREKLKINTFLPSKGTIRTCLNKMDTYIKWVSAGIKQPKTMIINDKADLKSALKEFDGNIWIRDTFGAGGRGSLPTRNFKIASAWLDLHDGWGKYTAAECLTPQSTTWQSIWSDGELVVAQGRKRMYWELSKLTLSGVTGATGTGVTVSDKEVDRVAQEAIFAVDSNPNGIFSVDLTYDKDGEVNPTEINIARFFTTHEFFTRAGLNMPYIFVKLAYGEPIPKIKRKINPLPSGLAWIRGMDFVPILTTLDEIKSTVVQ